MLFIFNRDVITITIIALLLLCQIALLWKFDVIAEQSIFLPGSWALFAASLIGTGIGLKARFFYIFPTWVFTLPCALYTTYNFWETTLGFLKIALLLFIAFIVFIILVIYIQEKRKLKNIFRNY